MTLSSPDSGPAANRLALLYQISREISPRHELADLLPRLLTLIVEGFHAFTGSLLVLDERAQPRQAALLVDGEFRPDPLPLLAEVLAHGLAGWVVRHKEPSYVPNTAADPRWYHAGTDRPVGARSALVVPVVGRDQVLGVLSVGRREPEAFTPEDLALLTALAANAGIALENVQLLAAERRGRDISNMLRETARTINATLDFSQVLPLMLEQLGRVVTFDTATVLLLRGPRLEVSAARGFADGVAVLRVSFDPQRGVIGRVLRDRRVIVLDDVQTSPEWQTAPVPETARIRGWIGAPLIAKDEVMGLLSIDSWQPQAYSAADAQIVAAFAEQAAVAVLNARLFAASEHRAYGLRALATTAQAINGTFELPKVLRLVVTHAQEWLGMEGASLALIQDGQLVFKEAVGPTADSLRGVALRLGAGIAGWVAQHNEPIIVPDVRADKRFFQGLDERSGFQTRALACVPVRQNRRAIGVIEVVNPATGVFDPDTLAQLDSLAALAGAAIAQAQHVAELQAAENRFAGLFEDSLDPILISDLDGVVTDANHSAVGFFGYRREELVGLRIHILHRVKTDSLTAGRYAPLLNGEPISYETRITTKAGAEVPVEVHAKLIQRDGEQFIYWIQHDLSERLALEELRNDLISMIVHDLRSPLGNMVSALDLLRGAVPADDEMVTSLLTIAGRSGARLARLVDSLLDLRRLEVGELGVNRLPVDLGGLFTEALEQVEPSAAGKRLSLRASVPPELPPAGADADLIRRVIINLLDNAIKYTPPDGQITLSAKRTGPNLTVSVRDTGPGVPEGERQRVFDKFMSVQREAGPKGLGLGLAFCKLAVEAHGGAIWVDSGRGPGATFSFTLPLAATAELRPADA
ncbi:MAG: GAF domain-containing protein [Anaerolineales bacterium]|nr:GAF domain-containing protein [Anaerolineales bacterium]